MSSADTQVLRFGTFTIDFGAAEIRIDGDAVPVEPQVFNLIGLLASRPGQVISRDEIIDAVWDGRFISESAVSTRINAARKALGDDGSRQHVIKTVHGRGFRFELEPLVDGTLSNKVAEHQAIQPLEVRYCTTSDGVSLAYAENGSGVPLVKTASFMTHLQLDSEGLLFAHWISELSKRYRFIRYDERGNGLSDWEIESFSFEAMVNDLETIVDTLGLEKVALLGASQGASVSIEYARRHPEKVGCMIICGGYAAGWRHSDDEKFRATRDALLELTRATWGADNPAGRQAYAALYLPGGTVEQHSEFMRLQKMTTTPENAYRILQTFSEIDVRDALSQVHTPTLVLHCRDDGPVPFEAGRLIASKMPNAKFVMLEGDKHIIQREDPGWPRFMEEIENFIAEHMD